MFCEKCGTQLNDTALFCTKCGAKTSNYAESETAMVVSDEPKGIINQVEALIEPVKKLEKLNADVAKAEQVHEIFEKNEKTIATCEKVKRPLTLAAGAVGAVAVILVLVAMIISRGHYATSTSLSSYAILALVIAVILFVLPFVAGLIKKSTEQNNQKLEGDMENYRRLDEIKQEIEDTKAELYDPIQIIPEKYRSSIAITALYDALKDQRAESIKEAITVYEDDLKTSAATKCPKCGSINLTYQIVTENKKAGCLKILFYAFMLMLPVIGWIVVVYLIFAKTTVERTYAVCQDCGHKFPTG